MNTDLLIRFGLTSSQAKTYIALIDLGSLTPPQLAKAIEESRTNAYMSLNRLEEIGLAKRDKRLKKLTYVPVTPAALQDFIHKRKNALLQTEDLFRSNLSDMLAFYYANLRQPGVRYFQGVDGIKDIYEDILNSHDDVYLLRTYADEDYFGDWLYEFMENRANAGITTHCLLPLDVWTLKYSKKNDARLKRISSWYPKDAYTAPVEINSYGNKVSIISFRKEASGTIIDDPDVALALRELLKIAKVGSAKLLEDQKT